MTKKVESCGSLFPITKPPPVPRIIHWHIGRQQRIMPNKHVYYTLKSIEKYLEGKKSNSEREGKIRDYLIDKGVMKQPKVNKKNVKHREIESKPGTVRTLISQYNYVGLLFREKRKVFFTQAGKRILSLKYERKGTIIKKDKEDIEKIMTHLLCRLQFNSEHYHSVGMDKNIKLKPVLFIVKLLQDKNISYLTEREFYILYYKAKTIDDYDKIVEDILWFREIKDIHHVLGHGVTDTIRNQSFPLLLVDRGILKFDNYRYSLNEKNPYITILEKYVKRYKKDKGHLSTQEHGKWGNIVGGKYDEGLKNELKIIIKNCSTIHQLEEAIKEQPHEPEMKGFLKEDPDLVSELKFEHELISDFLEPEKDLLVEKKIMHFSQDILKIETYHTGTIKNTIIRGGHSDNLNIFREEKCCGIMDTKVNHKRSYTLPGSDHRNMKGYIETFRDLLNQLGGRFPEKNIPTDITLFYAGFISSGFSKSIEKNLLKLEKEAGMPVFAMTISTYISLAKLIEEKSLAPKRFLHVMSQGGLITLKNFI